MKYNKWVSFAALILIVASCTSGENQNNNGSLSMEKNSKKAVKELMIEQEAAWNEGNIPGFMHFYKNDSNISFVSKRGVEKGFSTILQRYQKSYPERKAMGELKFEIIEFIPAGNHHLMVLGSWTLYRETDEPSGFFSLLWENTPLGWKIINDHTS